MDSKPPNLPPHRNVRRDSPLAKAWAIIIEAIRFTAANTDRELASRIIAIVIAVCYLVAIAVHESAVSPIVPLAVVLLVPLGLIWFPEEVGGFTGYVSRGGYINNETPPAL